MDINLMKIDLDKVENGQWVENIPEAGDLRVKVRGFNCIAYGNAVLKKRQNIPRGEREADGSLSAELEYKITSEALAEVILLDWDCLKSKGSALPYSKELATQMLTDRSYQPFRSAVMWAAAFVGDAAAAVQEEVLGNSETSSSGSETTGTSAPN